MELAELAQVCSTGDDADIVLLKTRMLDFDNFLIGDNSLCASWFVICLWL